MSIFVHEDAVADASAYEAWCEEQMENEEPICNCEKCGEPIYTGDTYYDVCGEIYCEHCMDEMSHIA